MKGVMTAIESEKTILGAILLDNGVIRDVADRLSPPDFDIYFHAELFECMLKLYKKNGVVDVTMISSDLKLNEEHERYVYELANGCHSTRNVKAHADIVREKSVQRKLLAVSNEIKAQKNEKLGQVAHLASFLEECAAELRITKVTNKYLVSLLVEIAKGFSQTLTGESEE